MQTDSTEVAISGERHPSLAELKDPSHPWVAEHLARCSMCRSVVAADEDGEPIPLDLPKGLVSENAFRWPADPTARGGMAQIFTGHDRRLSRTVILKAPRDGDDLPVGMAEMFQRRVTAEARILAKLQHPSIVTIYELGKSTAGWPFCVLEKVDGVSLRDRLDELAAAEAGDGAPRTRERLELLANLVSIAEALAYAHERRIVHRDCTPNNILLGKRGEATLIDWGIARDLDAPGLTADPALVPDGAANGRSETISAGTPPYLPLEQTQGRRADPSFDVYSFGITLYEVVAGRTPFTWQHVDAPDARSRQLAMFLDWLRAGPPPPPAMPRDPELSGIIARAMARAAHERFTADELVRALKQYLTGDLVFSHRYSMTGRLARWARRHRGAAVALVSLVLFAIGGAGVWVQLSRRAQQAAELRAIAAAARADASEKGREADQATREAEAAEALAEKAQKESKDAEAMRRDAEAKRRAAEAKRREFEEAALRAKDDADDAFKRYAQAEQDRAIAERDRDAARAAQQAAERDRDAARAAQQIAEHERDAARSAREAAERDRDAARSTAVVAEADRDAARATATAAERDRDAARSAQQAAERERDAALAARTAAERERDEARRKAAGGEPRPRERERERAPERDPGVPPGNGPEQQPAPSPGP